MKKVIVTIPKTNGDKWKVSMFGSSGKHRFSASTAYQLVERHLNIKRKDVLVPELEGKTSISVKKYVGSSSEVINESLPSNQSRYLLYCLACFLEDFLPITHQKKFEKYGNDF